MILKLDITTPQEKRVPMAGARVRDPTHSHRQKSIIILLVAVMYTEGNWGGSM